MNIFFLSRNPRRCARWHVDRHCVKMILETAQLLCSAIWLCNEQGKYLSKKGKDKIYKLTHKNHPSAIWTRDNKSNWKWLKKLGLALCEEYQYRYGKVHKSYEIIKGLKCPALPEGEMYDPPQAMKDEYKKDSAIRGYRNLYAFGKDHLHFWKYRHAWKKRNIPRFIIELRPEYEKYN